MRVQTWLQPPATGGSETASDSAEGTENVTAVVIDVLRATTVATTALAAGARSIATCRNVDEAFAMRDASGSDSPPLLCGERGCRRIDGFDFGNSPSEYSPAGVGGRDLILTTTNGTAAIDAAADAQTMILASFANLSAVVDDLIVRHGADRDAGGTENASGLIRLVCSGTNGDVTTEDVLLAGALLAACHRRLSDSPRFYDGPVELTNDCGAIALAVWQHSLTHEGVTDSATLAERLSQTQGGRNLIAAGYESDLVDCGAIDVFDNVPIRTQCQPACFINASDLPASTGG